MKRNARIIGGYFFATMATAAVSFFSVPLLIRVLGTELFGRWSLLEPLQLVVSQIMLLGLTHGIIKLINFDKRPPYATFTSLLRGAQPSLIVISLAVFLVLPHLGFSAYESGWFSLLIYSEAVFLILMAAFRAAGDAREYSASSLTRALLFLAVLLVTVFGSWLLIVSLRDVLLWRLIAAVAGILACLGMFKKKHQETGTRYRLDDATTFGLYMNAVRYGSPILVTGLLAMVIEIADRYILKAFVDYTTIAHYVVYMKIAAFLNPLIIGPFSIWWPTERFRRQQTPDGGMAFFRRTALLMLTVLLLAGGVLWFLSPWLITWFAPGIPSSPGIILLLIASVIFMGMGAPLNIGLLDAGRTHLNIYGAIGGALLHLLFCFLLIPNQGMAGAALATVLSYFFYTMFLNILSQRVQPVAFAYFPMLSLIIISFLEILAIQSFTDGAGFSDCLIKSILYTFCFSLSVVIVLLREKVFRSADSVEACEA